MAGQTHTKMETGDRCIIHVNDVNSPTGWWWGVIDTFKWNEGLEGWGSVSAHITGPFAFTPDQYQPKPMYGAENIVPTVNYTLYRADLDMMFLVKRLIRAEAQQSRLRIINAELRSVIKSAVSLTPETITVAVKKALEEQTA